MTKPKLSIAQTLVAGCLLASSGLSLAAPTPFTWNYNSSSSPDSWGTGVGQEGYISSALTISNATAWANTNGTDGTLTSKFATQTLQNSGEGLRVLTNTNGQSAQTNETGGAPNHGMDNNGAQEFILFQFSQAVSLSQLAISYPGTSPGTWASEGATNNAAGCTDGNCVQNGIATSSPVGSDMTVLAYTGADQANMATYLAGLDSGATGIGDTSKFKKVDVTANLNGTNTALNFAGGAPTSKFWLVGAYNQLLGGSLSANNDSVKLKSLSGSFSPGGGGSVPEPSTLTLAALGLLGAGGVRRRKQNRS